MALKFISLQAHSTSYTWVCYLLVVLPVPLLCTSCYFYSADERDAFCRDKQYSSSEYENLKTYKECMRDAGRLIYEYEEQKKVQEEQAIQNRILYEQEQVRDRAERDRQNREYALRMQLAREAEAKKERAEQFIEAQRAQQKQASQDAQWRMFSD